MQGSTGATSTLGSPNPSLGNLTPPGAQRQRPWRGYPAKLVVLEVLRVLWAEPRSLGFQWSHHQWEPSGDPVGSLRCS